MHIYQDFHLGISPNTAIRHIHSKLPTAIKIFTYLIISSNTYCVVPYVPITNQDCNIPIRGCKRNGNYRTVVNNKSTKTTRSSLKIERGEVKETPNLILNLELVSPIPFWRNGTISTKNSILPRTSSLLNTRPI